VTKIQGKGYGVSRQPSIAVIDDDESFRIAVVESLLSLGYAASGFACGEDFIAMDGLDVWDCAITDIHMPGMSGLELAGLLASRGRKTPIIMITARKEPGLDASCAASGAICLLRKPFRTDALVECLDKALKP
jgi:FixJ family two-component response regulator